MGWYIPQGMFRSLSQSQLSKKQGKMNGMLNNSAIGQKTGKLLMKADGVVPKNMGVNVSPEPSVTREHNYDGVVPKIIGSQLRDAVTTATNLAEGKKFEDTYMQRDESNPVYDTNKPKAKLWDTIKQGMSKLPTPGSLTVKNIMNR